MDMRSRLSTLSFMLLVLVLGVLSGVVLDRQFLLYVYPAGVTQPGKEADLSLIDEAWQIVSSRYVAFEDVDQEKLIYGAITGMVDALGDEGHSRFLDPEALESQTMQMESEFEGIGATVEFQDDHAVIVAPFDGSPAQEAGIKPGDIILAVDGEDTTGQTLSDIVGKIRGPAGTDVTLTLLDPETEEVREVTVTRAVIPIVNVRWAKVPGTDLGVVRIAQFGDGVTDDLKEALREMQDQGVKGIILDLRNNTGGLRDEAVGVTSQFLSEGNVLLQQDAQGNIKEFPVKSGGLATDANVPLVVLVNEGTASASEITAGALQDYKRAQIIGQTTFGTGTVLQTFGLSDGSAILLATSEWLTPNGRVIWHEGLAPDIAVELPTDILPLTPEQLESMSAAYMQSYGDTQFMRAIEVLKEALGEAQ